MQNMRVLFYAGTLAKTLDAHKFRLSRLKTGTPPRIDSRTVDYSGMEVQPTDDEPIPFSFLNMANTLWTPSAEQACLPDHIHLGMPVSLSAGLPFLAASC